ncbi:MAG: tRNA pseudouridine(38-40) synthase TruA [candidate division Zixibacteria bacterium RBG_16_43_9]|nr:MAG: tRNA pseudouridine(38-40) synthase TruA [candidate division Zixibacteria bacterium RBG_16_43_9]
MSRNVKLKIEYDGTGFSGWQKQPKLRTVQGEIEDKLTGILREKITLIGSGRTDVGVHALEQVANFKTETKLNLVSMHRGLNSLLPKDILIKDVEEVDSDFNSRYGAKSRVYRYKICFGKDIFLRRFAWEVSYCLDLSKIKKATKIILGRQNFTSFCVGKSAKPNNHCFVFRAFWKKDGNKLEFEIEADRFLHTMVRSLVGTLIDVGRGYFSLKDFADILKAKDHKKAGLTAPAKGLYLVRVNY